MASHLFEALSCRQPLVVWGILESGCELANSTLTTRGLYYTLEKWPYRCQYHFDTVQFAQVRVSTLAWVVLSLRTRQGCLHTPSANLHASNQDSLLPCNATIFIWRVLLNKKKHHMFCLEVYWFYRPFLRRRESLRVSIWEFHLQDAERSQK